MNKLTIIGNLTKDPELRSTQDGTQVCGFSVAVNRPKKKDGSESGADYFNVSAWRNLGTNCNTFLKKGNKVCVIGRITLRQWEKEGKHGASLEVTADEVEFLNTRVSDAPTPAEPSAPVDTQSGMALVETDELPF